MQDTKTWWESVKSDDTKLIDWLKVQYHGEATAADRIRNFMADFPSDNDPALEIIAKQEEIHASWVGELLTSRGVEPSILPKDERYWNETLPQITSFEEGAAVAAQAEAMRLVRIRTISEDGDAPADVRHVFQAILSQEIHHERMFRSMTTPQALATTCEGHVRGLEALGLIL